MDVLRKIIIGLGSIVVVALVLALAAPKAVRAVVSTLVTVSNTGANPVPTVSAEARTAFVEQGTCTSFVLNDCSAFLYNVPSGETAVIDSISGVCTLDSGTAVAEYKLSFTSPGGSLIELSVPGVTLPFGGNSITTAGQNLKTYAAAGSIVVTAVTNSISETSSNDKCFFALSGHIAP